MVKRAASRAPTDVRYDPKSPDKTGEPADLGDAPTDADDGPDPFADDPAPLPVKQFYVIPRDLFDRLVNAGQMEAYCEKHGVPWRGGVHQGDITIL